MVGCSFPLNLPYCQTRVGPSPHGGVQEVNMIIGRWRRQKWKWELFLDPKFHTYFWVTTSISIKKMAVFEPKSWTHCIWIEDKEDQKEGQCTNKLSILYGRITNYNWLMSSLILGGNLSRSEQTFNKEADRVTVFPTWQLTSYMAAIFLRTRFLFSLWSSNLHSLI